MWYTYIFQCGQPSHCGNPTESWEGGHTQGIIRFVPHLDIWQNHSRMGQQENNNKNKSNNNNNNTNTKKYHQTYSSWIIHNFNHSPPLLEIKPCFFLCRKWQQGCRGLKNPSVDPRRTARKWLPGRHSLIIGKNGYPKMDGENNEKPY